MPSSSREEEVCSVLERFVPKAADKDVLVRGRNHGLILMANLAMAGLGMGPGLGLGQGHGPGPVLGPGPGPGPWPGLGPELIPPLGEVCPSSAKNEKSMSMVIFILSSVESCGGGHGISYGERKVCPSSPKDARRMTMVIFTLSLVERCGDDHGISPKAEEVCSSYS